MQSITTAEVYRNETLGILSAIIDHQWVVRMIDDVLTVVAKLAYYGPTKLGDGTYHKIVQIFRLDKSDLATIDTEVGCPALIDERFGECLAGGIPVKYDEMMHYV